MEEFVYFYPLNIFPAFILLSLGIYILSKNTRQTINRIFACFTFGLFLSGINGVMYRTSFNAAEARLWDFSYYTPLFFSFAFLLHFCYVFYRRQPVRDPRIYLAIYLPIPALIYLERFTRLVNDHYFRDSLGHFYAAAGPLELARYVVLIAYPLVGIYFLYRTFRENTDPFLKKQALVVISGLIFPLVIGSLTDEILPLIGIQTGSFLLFSFLFMAIFLVVGITRYQFGRVSLDAAVDTTVWAIPAAVLTTDLKGNVTYCNPPSNELFGSYLYNKNLADLEQGKELEAKIGEIIQNRSLSKIEVDLKRGNNSIFRAEMNGSLIVDQKSGFRALLWDVHDLSFDLELKASLLKKQAELNNKIDELRRLNEFMAGREERLHELRQEATELRTETGQPSA